MSRAKESAILTHALRLKRIFPATADWSPVTLYKRLHRIEAEAHSFAERECNENIPEDVSKRKEESILRRLDAVLDFKRAGVPVFVNGDPRGYALKIEDTYVKANDLEIERDWGGYGILAPDF